MRYKPIVEVSPTNPRHFSMLTEEWKRKVRMVRAKFNFDNADMHGYIMVPSTLIVDEDGTIILEVYQEDPIYTGKQPWDGSTNEEDWTFGPFTTKLVELLNEANVKAPRYK